MTIEYEVRGISTPYPPHGTDELIQAIKRQAEYNLRGIGVFGLIEHEVVGYSDGLGGVVHSKGKLFIKESK